MKSPKNKRTKRVMLSRYRRYMGGLGCGRREGYIAHSLAVDSSEAYAHVSLLKNKLKFKCQ